MLFLEKNIKCSFGVGDMGLRTWVIVIVICIFAFVFRFLYDKQFGAVGYFMLSLAAFYFAYKEWKKIK